MNGTFLIRTFGCQMNEHDSERIGGMLRADGMTPTDDVADARVIVLNTCAIRENADNKLYGNLGHLKPLKAEHPDLRIVVAGCLAQKDQGVIQEKAPWVDVVVGTHALPHLLDLLRRAEADGPQMDVDEYTDLFPSALPSARDDAFRAWVSIAVGCDNACTFCIVPFVRGAQRSRAIGDVLAEIQGLAREGVVEVTLLGQNVNTYGRDVTVPGSSRRPLFADLLRQVNEVEGLRRIRFTSPHPHDFTPDVIGAMAESDKVCEHIHFPLQSGSDHVLKDDAALVPAGAVPGMARRDPRRDPRDRGVDGHHRRLPRRDGGGLRRHVGRGVARAVRLRVHVPVLAATRDPRRLDAGPGVEGGRPGAVRPVGGAPAGDLAREVARADRHRGGGARGGDGTAAIVDAVSDPDEQDRPSARSRSIRARS